MGSYPIDFTLSAATVDSTGATYPGASSASTSWRKFRNSDLICGEGPAGGHEMGYQCIRVSTIFTTAAATATLKVIVVDTQTETADPRVFVTTLTCAASADRTGLDGASLNYLGTTVDSLTGRDTVDLLGHLGPRCELYIGATALSAGSIRVRIAPTRDAG